MTFRLQDFTLRHYVRHVRKQSKHVQHIHAIAFAGIITACIAAVILYAEYGFWHQTYRADDIIVVEEEVPEFESPSQAFSQFFEEARERFKNIGSLGSDLLEGRETYRKSP